MKVQIKYTMNVTTEDREAIGRYFKTEGPATREMVQLFYETHGTEEAEKVLAQQKRQRYLDLSKKYAAMAKSAEEEPAETDGDDDGDDEEKESGETAQDRDGIPW